MEVSLVSWNMCGMGKLYRWPTTLDWLLTHDVILIQESLQVTPNFALDNVTRFDYPAKATAGRARGGLVIALNNHKFGNARVAVLVEEEFLLAVNVTIPATQQSLVIVNVYAPVHSTGYSADIISTVRSHLEQLILLSPPSAAILIAGTHLVTLLWVEFNNHYVFMCRHGQKDSFRNLSISKRIKAFLICTPGILHSLIST
jgi:hypothetical protein